MAQGRPTTPTEIKQLRGTFRADRLPKTDLLATSQTGLPKPPGELAEPGLSFWDLAWNCPWISSSSDLTLVVITCQNLDERQTLREAIIDNPSDRRIRTSLREVEKQILTNLGLLGFTPSDRSRLGVSELKKESKLEALLRLKAEKQAERLSEPGAIIG